MAYLKTGSYHHRDIAHHRFAFGLLALKGQINSENHSGSDHYHAAGITAIGFGVLPADGL